MNKPADKPNSLKEVPKEMLAELVNEVIAEMAGKQSD
jgi:hypothetical protein